MVLPDREPPDTSAPHWHRSWRNCPVPDFEFCLSCLTVAGLGLGGLGILWARIGREPIRISWGRRLFVAAVVFLGVIGLVAAFHRAEALAPLGLTAGML